jgi:hypothetical protein
MNGGASTGTEATSRMTTDASRGTAARSIDDSSTITRVGTPSSAAASSPTHGTKSAIASNEPPQTIAVVGQVRIQRGAGEAAFFFDTGMQLDVDGAPTAYHPPTPQSRFGSPPGLDDLRNAGVPGGPGQPGRWWALAIQPNGFPCIQGPDDPAPGFYVSKTALANRSHRQCDPRHYVDATQVPYVVLPPNVLAVGRARVGDFAAVHNRLNGQTAFAIFADVGPLGRIGEGSVALAQALGIPARGMPIHGGQNHAVCYLIFAGSGNRRPRTAAEIERSGTQLFQAWGGVARLQALFPAPVP